VTGFVPHHAEVAAGGAVPRGWLLVLHGIFGAGGNWRTFARRLVDRRPDWGCVLVDLRMHGRSQAAPPPHGVAAAAADLERLAAELAGQGRVVRGVAGHSFGGKVALALLGGTAERLRGWIFDASPSARPGALAEPGNSVVQVLEALEALPARIDGRDDFAARLAAAGLSGPLIAWLGLNLVPADGAWALRLDLAAVRALLADYYASDLWGVVEAPPGPLRFAVAGRGSAVSTADRARLAAIAGGGADLVVRDLPDAGHWLHIDALDALVDLVAADLPELAVG